MKIFSQTGRTWATILLLCLGLLTGCSSSPVSTATVMPSLTATVPQVSATAQILQPSTTPTTETSTATPPLPISTVSPTPTLQLPPTLVILQDYAVIQEQLKPGMYLVYWRGQASRLFVTSTSDPTLRMQFSDRPVGYQTADLSPDGQRLAYLTLDQTLMIYDLVSGQDSVVPRTPAMRDLIDPRWSPDGKHLVFSADDDDGPYYDSLYLLTLADNTLKLLTPWEDNKSRPTWSPDGKWIAFQSEDSFFGGDYLNQVFLLDTTCFPDLETCPQKALPIGQSFDGHTHSPTWSPDGQQLAFVFFDDNDQVIYVTNTQGGDPRKIYQASEGDWISYLGWSPDGQYIAFTLSKRNRDDDEDRHNYDVYVISPQGGEAINVTNTPIDDEYYSFWMVVK